ncbi:metal dependent phosphohydrolase [Acetivibrio thermocellus BC1]|nr:metal dependent phosphohydrolase [Acetivibrio thermocellus BC1]
MKGKIEINMPKDVSYIIDTLNNRGFKAYIVGGCIRDAILGKVPADWDVATDAQPEDVKLIFDKIVETGIKHGTVTAVINGCNYEITTFRAPSSAKIPTIKDDLGLRDFTINAMAYHPEEGIIDPFLGMQDMEKSVIRAVGSPEDRFHEDPLRMLRAVRLSSTLGFEIDRSVLSAIKENCKLIEKVSPERIRDELSKILISDRPKNFLVLRETGLLKYVLPEFDICFDTGQNHPYHVYNVGMHTLETVSNIESNLVLRWTMLLHDIGKPVVKTTDQNGTDHFYGHPEESVNIADKIMKRLRFDNKTTNKVLRLIKHHDRRIEPNQKSVRKAVSIIGKDIFPDLLKVQEADKKGQNPQYLDERLKVLDEIKDIFFNLKKEGQILNLKDLALNGNDLLAMGFEQSREIGIILRELYNIVLDNPEMNTKEKLTEIVENIRKKSFKT